MLGIVYTDYYVSEEMVGFNKILEENPNFNLPSSYSSIQEYYETFKKESHLDQISIMPKNIIIKEFSELIEKCLERTNIHRDKVAGLAYTDPVPFNSIINNNISIPHYLIEKFKFTNANVGLVQQQCTGFILSMGLARGILRSDQYLIILSAHCIEINGNKNFGYTLMGDGLGIAVLSNIPSKWEVIDFKMKTNGINTYHLYHDEELKYQVEIRPGDFAPETITQEIEKKRTDVIKQGTDLVFDLLEDNGLKMDDLFKFIPQNVHYMSYSFAYARRLKIDPQKIYLSNIAKGGHIGDVDLIRNLTSFEKEEQIPCNAKVVLYGLGTNGLDMTYGTVLLNYRGQ